LVAFFIASPFRAGCDPCADQPDLVVALLDEDREEDALVPRRADEDRALGMRVVLDDDGERVGE
jgi:hypothetical protein